MAGGKKFVYGVLAIEVILGAILIWSVVNHKTYQTKLSLLIVMFLFPFVTCSAFGLVYYCHGGWQSLKKVLSSDPESANPSQQSNRGGGEERATLMQSPGETSASARRGSGASPGVDPPNFRPPPLDWDNASPFLGDYPIYLAIKKIAAFLRKKRLQAETTSELAGKLHRALVTDDSGVPDYVLPVLAKINGEISVQGRLDTKLYEDLYTHLEIYVYEKRNGVLTEHKCEDHEECSEYCLLPIFARTVFTPEKVSTLYTSLSDVINSNRHLLSSARAENEDKNAKNLLMYVAANGNLGLNDSLDVLYAMAGHNGTIFDPYKQVDALLYQKVFDLLRGEDYARMDILSRVLPKKSSLPFMDSQSSDALTEIVTRNAASAAGSQTRSSGSNVTGNRGTSGNNDGNRGNRGTSGNSSTSADRNPDSRISIANSTVHGNRRVSGNETSVSGFGNTIGNRPLSGNPDSVTVYSRRGTGSTTGSSGSGTNRTTGNTSGSVSHGSGNTMPYVRFGAATAGRNILIPRPNRNNRPTGNRTTSAFGTNNSGPTVFSILSQPSPTDAPVYPDAPPSYASLPPLEYPVSSDPSPVPNPGSAPLDTDLPTYEQVLLNIVDETET